ncbi:MAG: hypothetical protein KC646_07090 [Candidatus Cloacimonetes bacterium]|nr:hypothetical protein [Candidatus Cloacimonadota bacterium]
MNREFKNVSKTRDNTSTKNKDNKGSKPTNNRPVTMNAATKPRKKQ